MTVDLDLSALRFAELSLVDECGRVFFWKERVFRAIRAAAVPDVRRLLESGLIEQLVGEGLFPATRVTDLRVPGYELVLEHDRVGQITYPFEWSFSMLKEAAQTVLRVNELANQHDYELKDCHAYNIAFDGAKPKFLDFGSLVRRQPGAQGWRAYEEFVQSYIYPLEIWRSGNHYLAQKILADQALMPHESFLLYRHPVTRRLSAHLDKIAKLYFVYYKSRLISEYSPEALRERLPTQLGRYLDWALALKDRGLLPLQRIDLGALGRRLERIKRTAYTTTWGDYHDELAVQPSTPRFDRVVALVRELGVKSVVELAGNQGVLASLLVERAGLERVVCTDGDETAVDRMYQRLRGGTARVMPALLDFMLPTCPQALESPWTRYRSDAVIALAVTHHLLLKPPFFKLEQILQTMARYATTWVMVEFMPLGLHDGADAPPLPSWYRLDWFRAEFARHFDLRAEEQLEPNRILFVGWIRSASSP